MVGHTPAELSSFTIKHFSSVNWATTTWTFDRDGFERTNERLEDICSPVLLATTLVPSRLPFFKAFQSCKMFNSEMETCGSEAADRAVAAAFREAGREKLCERRNNQHEFWCGYTDQQVRIRIFKFLVVFA